MGFTIDKREKILEKSNGVCHYCGVDLRANHIVANGERKKKLMTVDHVIPKSKGGSNRLYNLVASCYKCNHDKEDKINYSPKA